MKRSLLTTILAVGALMFSLFIPGRAPAQIVYNVTDLGVLNEIPGVPPPLPVSSGGFLLSCHMGLNQQGWTEGMEGFVDENYNFVGRATVEIDGMKIDLGTLGGTNSWINWGGINQRGSAVGLAETPVPDPDGEDICGFGTGLTCRPFLWQNGHMSALPTLGGNNGQASAINSMGQIAGQAETAVVDAECAPHKVAPPVLWENGKAQELPTVAGDPDGIAYGINDFGEAVGFTSTCTDSVVHAVLWQNGAATELPDLGSTTDNVAVAINNRGQIVGHSSADSTTFVAVLWQGGAITKLGVLPGDFAAFGSGINEKGQVVGSTLDVNFNFSRAFIWENGVMTDLNTLFLAGSNLYATMANKINDAGEISGMATVISGPHAGEIHAFLATPVNPTAAAHGVPRPAHLTVPENFRKLLLQRFFPRRKF